MKLSHVGIDLAKNVFQLHGVDGHGKAVWRRRLRRHQWLEVLLATIGSDCIVGMEACGGAQALSRGGRRRERISAAPTQPLKSGKSPRFKLD